MRWKFYYAKDIFHLFVSSLCSPTTVRSTNGQLIRTVVDGRWQHLAASHPSIYKILRRSFYVVLPCRHCSGVSFIAAPRRSLNTKESQWNANSCNPTHIMYIHNNQQLLQSSEFPTLPAQNSVSHGNKTNRGERSIYNSNKCYDVMLPAHILTHNMNPSFIIIPTLFHSTPTTYN